MVVETYGVYYHVLTMMVGRRALQVAASRENDEGEDKSAL